MPRSVTYTNNGDGTHTLAMEWTYPSATMNNLLKESSEYFYDVRWTIYDGEDPVAWDDLTALQKRYVLLYETTAHLKNGAYALYSGEAVQATKDGPDDPDTRYAVGS